VNKGLACDVDYVIIGQGLAGSLLAWELHSRGQDVLIYDNHRQLSSSMVASGLLNPVTGQRLHADDNVHELLDCAYATYRKLEALFSITLLQPLAMRRFARSVRDKQRWAKRREQPLYQGLIGEWSECEQQFPLNNRLGLFEQYHCARLDIAALLAAIKADFVKRQRYRQQAVRNDDIQIQGDIIRIHDITCASVVFCQGAQAKDNPWFSQNAWNISHGDILHFHCETSYPFIANYGYNYIPIGEHEFHWGSSFDTQYPNALPSQAGFIQLFRALEEFDKNAATYRLLTHYSGLRPATRDKQPLLGFHQTQAKIAIFNGFGARGSLLIPYYAHYFSSVLLRQKELHHAVDYQRFLK